MSVAIQSVPVPTLADLMARLGNVPQERILTMPPPGMATEIDVLRMHAQHKRLCELVDGVLVEKAMGFEASVVAMYLVYALQCHVLPRHLGVVSGPDGMMRLFPGLVRIPDVAFAGWDRFTNRRIPREPIPDLVPDLAVEVLSESNTIAEMLRKIKEYFGAGTSLVWIIDPFQRIVTVFESPLQSRVLRDDQELDGGEVLPGFRLRVAELFSQLDNGTR